MNEQEIRDLKAELEQVDYEEFEELRKRLESLEFKFNELVDILRANKLVSQSVVFTKVKEAE